MASLFCAGQSLLSPTIYIYTMNSATASHYLSSPDIISLVRPLPSPTHGHPNKCAAFCGEECIIGSVFGRLLRRGPVSNPYVPHWLLVWLIVWFHQFLSWAHPCLCCLSFVFSAGSSCRYRHVLPPPLYSYLYLTWWVNCKDASICTSDGTGGLEGRQVYRCVGDIPQYPGRAMPILEWEERWQCGIPGARGRAEVREEAAVRGVQGRWVHRGGNAGPSSSPCRCSSCLCRCRVGVGYGRYCLTYRCRSWAVRLQWLEEHKRYSKDWVQQPNPLHTC